MELHDHRQPCRVGKSSAALMHYSPSHVECLRQENPRVCAKYHPYVVEVRGHECGTQDVSQTDFVACWTFQLLRGLASPTNPPLSRPQSQNSRAIPGAIPVPRRPEDQKPRT